MFPLLELIRDFLLQPIVCFSKSLYLGVQFIGVCLLFLVGFLELLLKCELGGFLFFEKLRDFLLETLASFLKALPLGHQ